MGEGKYLKGLCVPIATQVPQQMNRIIQKMKKTPAGEPATSSDGSRTLNIEKTFLFVCRLSLIRATTVAPQRFRSNINIRERVHKTVSSNENVFQIGKVIHLPFFFIANNLK